MKKKGKARRTGKKSAKKSVAREIKKISAVCGCQSGKKWEECCGRCNIPC